MLLITNITIYDGTGADGYVADILTDCDKIAAIRPGITAHNVHVIDGTNLAVAPGFIDIHAHSEFSMLADPAAPSKVMQGVTTEVSGNCGLSAGPLIGEAAKAREKDFSELGINRTWTDLEGYLYALELAKPAINFVTLCGHGNLRASVIGYENREPTEEELVRMESLLDDAMKAGARGLSTGLIYPPGVYCKTDELVRLASVAARHGGIYTSHMRSEGARVVESIQEALIIGRGAGVPVQISHLKTAGPSNWHKIPEIIDTIEKARADGIAVTADRYPYTASSTDLDAILPAWTYEGGAKAEIKRLERRAIREKIKGEVLSSHPVPEYWNRVMISSAGSEGNTRLEGKTLAQAAIMRNQEPVEALFDILIEDGCRTQAIYFSMSEENLRTLLRQEWLMVGSDSSARGISGITRQGKPHPRGFGSFARVLGHYVREEGVLTLPQAVRKLSAQAAEKLSLARRGYIKPGYLADMVIFDPAKVIDTATFEEPYSYPAGIRHVVVNGVLAVEDGRQTEARAGRILK